MPELDLFSIVILGFWAYCIFDVIRTPEGTTENLPKMLWLIIVIFLSAIGGLAWLLLGRPRNTTYSLRTNAGRDALPPAALPSPPPPPHDDDYHRKREEALRRYHAEREDELRKKEQELERRAEELRKREQGTSEST